MKKIISLSAGVFLTAMAFAQQDSASHNLRTTMDTMPMSQRNMSDTSRLGAMNHTRNWQDSSQKTTWKDSSLTGNKKWPDTMSAATMTPAMGGSDTTLKSSSVRNTRTYRKDNMSSQSTVAGSTQTQTDSMASKKPDDRVVMKGDHVMLVKNGDSTLLADSIKLKSGAVVMKNGMVRFSNGTTTQLKNGQFISLTPEMKKPKKAMPKSKA